MAQRSPTHPARVPVAGRLGSNPKVTWSPTSSSHSPAGHTSTTLSKVSWPLLQLSLLFTVVSLGAPNWTDGQPAGTPALSRLYVGAWRACREPTFNSSHSQAGALPAEVCSDTAAFIVDGMKTQWVSAWRGFLLASTASLFLASILLSCYLFGGRIFQHSTFPLFWSFVTGFASGMFGTLALVVFHVKSQKSPELRGVSYGWALGLNMAAVMITFYNNFVALGGFIELTAFRMRRKNGRRRQHMTFSAEHTFSRDCTLTPGGGTATNARFPRGGGTRRARALSLPIGGSTAAVRKNTQAHSSKTDMSPGSYGERPALVTNRTWQQSPHAPVLEGSSMMAGVMSSANDADAEVIVINKARDKLKFKKATLTLRLDQRIPATNTGDNTT